VVTSGGFHPPVGKFDGVIGRAAVPGVFDARRLNRAQGREPRFGDLGAEFSRCVDEAQPTWFPHGERTPQHRRLPSPATVSTARLLNNRWLGEEGRTGAGSRFGTPEGHRLRIETRALEAAMYADTVDLRWWSRAAPRAGYDEGCRGDGKCRRSAVPEPQVLGTVPRSMGVLLCDDGYSIEEACVLQGLPADHAAHFPVPPRKQLQVLANAVPREMGRASCRREARAHRGGPVTPRDRAARSRV